MKPLAEDSVTDLTAVLMVLQRVLRRELDLGTLDGDSVIKLGRTCLLLDVDGVLRDRAWREGLKEFMAWAWATFDLVLLLTANREFAYESWPGSGVRATENWGPCPPSLAWKGRKMEPLAGLLCQGYRLFWAEDGVLESEARWCRRHAMAHYVGCRGATTLDMVQDRILQAMAEARKGG